MTAIRVVLGDPVTGLDLTDPTGPFEVYASSAQGTTDLGNPVPITETVESGLQDGTLVRWLRDDNRQIRVYFGVKGNDLDSVARAVEYQVVPLTKIQTLLTVYPADAAAEAAVFEVWTSVLEIAPLGSTDLDEVRNEKRRLYSLTLTAQPYVRPLNPVVSPALAGGGGAPVVLDNGSSASGWTATTGGSVTSSGTVLTFPLATIATGIRGFTVVKTISSRNFTTTPYFFIDIVLPNDTNGNVNPPATHLAQVNPGTSTPTFMLSTASPTLSGGTRYWFSWNGTPPTAATTVAFTFTWLNMPGLTAGVTADNLTTQGDPPALAPSSPIRTIPIQGSQRTEASLRVKDCLGVYTAPSIGYQSYDPASIVSGSPVQIRKVPVGSYVIVMSGTFTSSAGTVGTKANITVSTTFTQGSVTKTVKRIFQLDRTLTGGTVAQLVGTFPVGSISLPLLEVSPGSTDTITGTISVSGGTFANLSLPSGSTFQGQWGFWMGEPGKNEDDCALTIPKWGNSGTSLTSKAYTWIDAATVDRPRPGIWGGTAADKSDAVNMVGSAEPWMSHQFSPGQATLFVIGGQADLTYYPRWHTWPVNIT